MFSCHGCLAGALRAVAHDVPLAVPLQRNHVWLARDATRRLSTGRHVSSSVATATTGDNSHLINVSGHGRARDGPDGERLFEATEAHGEREFEAREAHSEKELETRETHGERRFEAKEARGERGLQRRDTRGEGRLQIRDGRHSLQPAVFKEKHLRRELEYLGDPVKLGDAIKRMLHDDQSAKALEMVRLQSRSANTVVSWNHLVNHAMSRGEPGRAWSLFNEMKKRAQRPDAVTYMLMLRGLAEHAARVPSAFEKAVTVYHSMTAPNSAAKPSLKHTNAILLVCARARQMDTLFEIAAKLPSAGRGAADTITFTTILNAIRIDVSDSVQHFGQEAMAPDAFESRVREAIRNGKRIWQDVVARWIEGSLTMDEELVCAMGRLLLVGGLQDNSKRDPQDVDDILSLLEQAMDVPRQIDRFKWRTRAAKAAIQAPPSSSNEPQHRDSAKMQNLDQGMTSEGAEELDGDTSKAPAVSEQDTVEWKDGVTVFDAVPLREGSLVRMYARPGNDALSMAVTAAGSLHEYQAATRYWDLLTQVVRPDRENCHGYLRVLRAQRASRHSLAFVKQMRLPRANGGLGIAPVGSTFRIAMSACARDANNAHCLDSALQLLGLMRASLDTPDPGAVSRFLDILRVRGRRADVGEATAAVELLHALVDDLEGALRYGEFGRAATTAAAPDPDKDKDVDEDYEYETDRDRKRHDDGYRRRGMPQALTTNAVVGASEGGDGGSSGESVSADANADAHRGRLSPRSRGDVIELAKAVETATARTINYYVEHLPPATRRAWHAKLARLAKLTASSRRNAARTAAANAARHKNNGDAAIGAHAGPTGRTDRTGSREGGSDGSNARPSLVRKHPAI